MATSSILTSVKITDPKKIESFIKALDASADEPKREPSASVSRQMTNQYKGFRNAIFVIKTVEQFSIIQNTKSYASLIMAVWSIFVRYKSKRRVYLLS